MSPRLALILKYPLMSVTVPMVVPLITTFTPANGTGGSTFSTTCPWIVHSLSSARRSTPGCLAAYFSTTRLSFSGEPAAHKLGPPPIKALLSETNKSERFKTF